MRVRVCTLADSSDVDRQAGRMLIHPIVSVAIDPYGALAYDPAATRSRS
jgi:hypothetical protein